MLGLLYGRLRLLGNADRSHSDSDSSFLDPNLNIRSRPRTDRRFRRKHLIDTNNSSTIPRSGTEVYV